MIDTEKVNGPEKIVNTDWDMVLKLANTLAWPIVVLIAILIFWKPLRGLLARVNKGTIMGNSFELAEHGQSDVQKQQLPAKRDSDIEKLLAIFSEQTVSDFTGFVNRESGIDNYESDSNKLIALKNYSVAIYLKFYFEDVYQVIFGSQISLLQYLNSRQNGEVKAAAKPIFDNAVNNFSAAYGDYSYDEYLKFLQIKGLIIETDDRIKITFYGKDFLKYILEMGKDVYKNM